MESYKGQQKKWCNRLCIDEYRKKNGYWKKLYKKKHPELKTRLCNMCGRNIIAVGKKQNVSKYCSDKCMYLYDRTKRGQKSIFVKIPSDLYPKLFINE